MIKLVLTDMDGTLLKDDKTMPKDAQKVFQQLLNKDIICGAATGRSIPSLFRDFDVLKEKLTFIAENGAIICHKNKILYKAIIEPQVVKDVIEKTKTINNTYPVLCAYDKAYTLKGARKYKHNFQAYYPQIEFVDDLSCVNDEIFKIAVYDEVNSEQNSYPILRTFEDNLNVIPSGKEWVDISLKGVNKGAAIEILQEKLNVKYEESMAFGDFLNDITMLKNVEYSYAVENAHPKIKEVCKYICKSNEEEGVLEELKTHFKL